MNAVDVKTAKQQSDKHIIIRRKEDLCRNGAGFEEVSLMFSYLIVIRFLFLVDFLKPYHEWVRLRKSERGCKEKERENGGVLVCVRRKCYVGAEL